MLETQQSRHAAARTLLAIGAAGWALIATSLGAAQRPQSSSEKELQTMVFVSESGDPEDREEMLASAAQRTRSGSPGAASGEPSTLSTGRSVRTQVAVSPAVAEADQAVHASTHVVPKRGFPSGDSARTLALATGGARHLGDDTAPNKDATTSETPSRPKRVRSLISELRAARTLGKAEKAKTAADAQARPSQDQPAAKSIAARSTAAKPSRVRLATDPAAVHPLDDLMSDSDDPLMGL